MAMAVHYSTGNHEWGTPPEVFDPLAAEFGPFDLDVCARPWNAKAAKFFSPDDDGLLQTWTGRCFMNPPYGSIIRHWVRKAYEEAVVLKNATVVVCLLPARTDTRWFHDYCAKGEVRFIQGRVCFQREREREPEPTSAVPKRDRRSSERAPFPCVIVIFRSKQHD